MKQSNKKRLRTLLKKVQKASICHSFIIYDIRFLLLVFTFLADLVLTNEEAIPLSTLPQVMHILED